MEVTNDRSEATKAKITDMRARLESLRKRKLEEEATEVIVEDLSPAKKSLQEVTEVAQNVVVPNDNAQIEDTLIQNSYPKASSVEVIDLDDSADADSCPAKPLTHGPVLTLKFHDQQLAKLYGETVRDAVLRILSEADFGLFKNLGKTEASIQIFESELRQQAGELFVVDTLPALQESKAKVPAYAPSFSAVMDGQEAKQPEVNGASTFTCFNCGAGHLMSECSLPYNEKAVAERKSKFMAVRRSNNQSLRTRYHDEGEQKYPHHRPGVISDELRAALNLRPDQLPMHIYLMRMHGYPPGWMQEAKQTQSGISLLGEMEGPQEEIPETIDTSKIIDYPGFNVMPPRGVYDESRLLGMPPMNIELSKEVMISYINLNQMQAQPYQPVKSRGVKESSDDDVVVLNSNNNSTGQSPTENSNSPDIEVLEMQKDIILKELGGGSSATPASPPREEQPAPPGLQSPPRTPEVSLGRSMSLCVGTPLIKSASPYEKLPTATSFSVGVSEHLNFENLPGSTGTYEKMKSIINKAKQVVDQM